MSKDEQKEMIVNTVERFMQLDETSRSFIVGYMTGTQDERQKWEQTRETATA